MAIVVPLVLNGLWSVINFTCVPNNPKDVGIETEESREQEAIALASGKDKDAEPSPIGIGQAFMLPNVMGYAIAFGFFKLINYAMFFQVEKMKFACHECFCVSYLAFPLTFLS